MMGEANSGPSRQEQEAISKGDELKDNLRRCLIDMEDILSSNPAVEPRDLTVLIDESLVIEVTPAEPITYQTRHLARPDSSSLLATREPFSLVRTTAVPVVDDDRHVSLMMYGNGDINEAGDFAVYQFDPLAGHGFAVTRRGEPVSAGVAYASGVAVRRLPSSGRTFFILY
ncbi:MAG TPA: hypothetical protein VFP35_03350 [Candidatus Saccharimonadales bacterium]|nr:hypothetical protein [Candidatus Saccharimonadales bacterium]